MSASASKRMPDLGYKAVNRYTGPPSCLPARMDKRYYMTDIQAVTATLVRPAAYQHGWTNGTMTDIQAVTASSLRLCVVSLRM